MNNQERSDMKKIFLLLTLALFTDRVNAITDTTEDSKIKFK